MITRLIRIEETANGRYIGVDREQRNPGTEWEESMDFQVLKFVNRLLRTEVEKDHPDAFKEFDKPTA